MLGRTILMQDLGKQPEGSHSWEWNGKDVNGNAVSAGILFYEIQLEKASLKGKLIKQE